MRCPDCNKFVSYGDPPEVEVNQSDISGNTLTADIRIILQCAECGCELKEANLEFEATVAHKCGEAEGEDVSADDSQDTDYTINDEAAEGTNTKKKGKTVYGADLTFTIVCNDCNDSFEVNGSVEAQSSEFDDLT